MATTVERGRDGEERAAKVLRAAGMSIERRNYRAAGGEVDIVARDGATLVFVEIRLRTRGDRGSALETISRGKQQRVARAAQHYLSFVAQPKGVSAIRFDVVGITGAEVVHVRDAFRVDGRY